MLKIKKVKLEKKEPVYDLLNVEDNSNFVCNGAVVSNCTEITLHSDEDHTYTCQPGFAPIIKLGEGLTSMDDVTVGDYIWTKEGWSLVTNKVCSGVKAVNQYITSSGVFIGTDDHRVLQNSVKVPVKDAEFIDPCIPPDRFIPDHFRLYLWSLYKSMSCVYYSLSEIGSNIEIELHISSKGYAINTFNLLCSFGLSPKLKFNDNYVVSLHLNEDIDVINSCVTINQLKFVERDTKLTRPETNEINEINYIGEFPVYHIEVANDSHTYWTGGLDVSNCVLSSLNLSKYDEWKDTDAIFNSTVFLDCVAAEFISMGKTIKGLEKAVRFTEKGRALGLGALGFHTYLQQKMIAFESLEAHFENINIFKHIRDEAEKATSWMAKHYGEPEWCKGYGRRNTHLLAIAPNMCVTLDTKIVLANNDIINYEELIDKLGLSLEEILNIEIINDDGSVLNLFYNEKVRVKCGTTIREIFAFQLKEGDEIV